MSEQFSRKCEILRRSNVNHFILQNFSRLKSYKNSRVKPCFPCICTELRNKDVQLGQKLYKSTEHSHKTLT